MSSSSSRYQSRLLNFISQQSHKVVDKCDRALRHLKFAAESALQATLYPVYLLFQTARAIGSQLQQVGKKAAAQLGNTVTDESLNYPEADAPIQQVLSFVEELSLPGSTTGTKTEEISAVNYSESAPKLGEISQAELPVFKDLIATSADALAQLDNKLEKSSDSPLLALGAAPEIPKIPVGNTIFSEVADYWQQQQRLVESQVGFSNDLQLLANQTHLFSLSRQFLQVMSWVQTSPIAVKVNLFGEANLLLAKTDNSISNYQFGNGFQQLAIPPLPSFGKVGRDYELPIANSSLPLVQGAIAPSQELPQTSPKNYTKYQTLNSLEFLQTKQPPAGKIAHREENPTKLVGIERFEEYVEQTVESVLSAIVYVFGKEEQSEKELAKHLYTEYQKTSILDRDRASEATELTWSDLFGETTASPTQTYAPPSASIAAQPANAQNHSQVNPSAAVSTPQTIATTVAKAQQAESSAVKPAPDCWEAEVISRGYVKHPLEQTLEWLDIALLWLEEIGVQLWNRAKMQLDKIFRSKN